MLNLFIFIIIEQFEALHSDDNLINLFEEKLIIFKKYWDDFNEKDANFYINKKYLIYFLKKISSSPKFKLGI